MGKAIIIKGVIPDERIDTGRVGVDQEVWMINCQNEPPKWDRWFQLHGLEHIWKKHGTLELQRLAQMSIDKPVYMYPTQIGRWGTFFTQELKTLEGKAKEAPHHNFREFPIEQMCDHWGIRYFTGSFALLVAHATWLHLHATQHIESIEFAGTDLWADPKHPQYPDEAWAISCTEFWLSKAHSAGIKIYPDSQVTGIMHDVWGGLYGYEAGGNE
jgi:hypothetical protein